MKDVSWFPVINFVLQLLNLYFVFKVLTYRKQEIAELREQNEFLIKGLEELQKVPAD